MTNGTKQHAGQTLGPPAAGQQRSPSRKLGAVPRILERAAGGRSAPQGRRRYRTARVKIRLAVQAVEDDTASSLALQ